MSGEPPASAKEEFVRLMDSSFTKTLLEVRAEEIVQAVVARWRTRSLIILTGLVFILGILGVNLTSTLRDYRTKLTEKIDAVTARITVIDADLDRRQEEIGKLKTSVDVTNTKLQIGAGAVEETTRQFLALARETDSIRTSSWRSLLDDERHSTRAELAALTERASEALRQLGKLRAALESERTAMLDVTQNANATLAKLRSVPTTTFVLLRRDIMRELKLEGALVKATLKHTRGVEARKGAELTFEVNEERQPPRILWENAVQLLDGTDYQVELMFVYDFPVFGKGVDFVMLKLSRGPRPRA